MRPQAVLDAIADAETLRLVVGGAAPISDDLWVAGWQGERSGACRFPLETPDQAAACARIAARAAFRACPGLR